MLCFVCVWYFWAIDDDFYVCLHLWTEQFWPPVWFSETCIGSICAQTIIWFTPNEWSLEVFGLRQQQCFEVFTSVDSVFCENKIKHSPALLCRIPFNVQDEAVLYVFVTFVENPHFLWPIVIISEMFFVTLRVQFTWQCVESNRGALTPSGPHWGFTSENFFVSEIFHSEIYDFSLPLFDVFMFESHRDSSAITLLHLQPYLNSVECIDS